MADVSRDQFMRILDAVNRGEIKLGTEDFTFGGGSSTGPTATEQQQANLDFLLKKAEEGRLTDANKEFLMGMTGTRYGSVQRDRLNAAQAAITAESGGSPGARAGMLIGAAQDQRGGTGGATVGAQPPSGGMGREQEGMVSTQPVGNAVPISQEQQQNQNFMQLLQSLGLEALLNLFQPAVYGQGGASTQSGRMFGVPANFGVAPTNVGYLPPQVMPLNPVDMSYQSVAQQSGMLNQILGKY